MNSTRTWVTPPREPAKFQLGQHFCVLAISLFFARRVAFPRGKIDFDSISAGISHTGTAEDAGDLDELDGGLRGIHCRD